jgi:hypothetical protein
VIVTAPITSGRQLAPGQVVHYDRPGLAGSSVVHRIVEVREDGVLVTRGDANAANDSTALLPSAVHGQVRLVVPALGLPATWLHDGHYALLALWGAGTVLLTGAGFGRRRPVLAAVSGTFAARTANPVTAADPPARRPRRGRHAARRARGSVRRRGFLVGSTVRNR